MDNYKTAGNYAKYQMTYVNPREAQAVFLVVENWNCAFATWNIKKIL